MSSTTIRSLTPAAGIVTANFPDGHVDDFPLIGWAVVTVYGKNLAKWNDLEPAFLFMGSPIVLSDYLEGFAAADAPKVRTELA